MIQVTSNSTSFSRTIYFYKTIAIKIDPSSFVSLIYITETLSNDDYYDDDHDDV